MQLTDFDVLTFDCYGTLIDWERGILDALRPLLATLPNAPAPDRLLQDFAAAEAAQEAATPGMLYRDVLTHVHGQLARRWEGSVDPAMAAAFGASVPRWPAFDDSAAALEYLSRHYKLVVLSNVDHKSFAGSRERLGITFDAVYTAEDIGAYKPSLDNFHYMLDRLAKDFAIAPGQILHTAQSLFHDHQPASRLGLARAWIDRRGGRAGGGATPVLDPRPTVDFHFPSMAALVEAHRQALASP